MMPVNCAASLARQVRRGKIHRGPVAQRIEQQPSKLKVAGSIPAGVASLKFLFSFPMILIIAGTVESPSRKRDASTVRTAQVSAEPPMSHEI